ncbi:MAG: VacB/RNase II family 3'-5' exoribonuclease [Terriglobia bacterium]
METTEEKILAKLKAFPSHLMSFKQMLREFELESDQRHELRHILHEMVKIGTVVKLKGNRYTLPPESQWVVGKLSLHRDGYGFVTPEKKDPQREGDIFIPARYVGDAMNGDKVMVSVEDSRRGGGRSEGRLVKVIERKHVAIVGQLKRSSFETYVIPYDAKIHQEVLIRDEDDMDAPADSMVNVEITHFPHGARRLRGKVVEILGFRGDFGIDVEIMIRKHQIPTQFTAAALRQAEEIPAEVDPQELERRADFRALPIVTIDGETAKDFDDAVHVEKLSNGNFVLGVHIADVSHYVRKDSPLDREAQRRGTSVYFPDRAVPMLPEKLSNGICSLNPKLDRLTFSVMIEIDPAGNCLRYSLHDGVIRSQERMTYTSVGKILVDQDSDEKARYPGLVSHFERMRELALLLNARRQARGSIDFDLPEPIIAFDEKGLMVGILKSERHIAHRIIEEFMLTANETVAQHLFKRKIASLYRIHESPDPVKVYEFNEIALSFGYSLGRVLGEKSLSPLPRLKERARRGRGRGEVVRSRNQELLGVDIKVSPKDYQKLVEQISGKPEERILSYLMLRSLKQACYSPQNKGHFGLASSCYTHFTSPIRRYPDLMVHRILRNSLSQSEPSNLGSHPFLVYSFGKESKGESAKGHREETPAERRAGKSATKGPDPAELSHALYTAEELDSIAVHSSDTERRSDEAERELVNLKKLEFMADKLGDEFEGIVIHITKEGMFVELTELFIEGFVRITTLDGDFQYKERPISLVASRGKIVYRLGDRLLVGVDRIDRFRQRVDLSVVRKIVPGEDVKRTSK